MRKAPDSRGLPRGERAGPLILLVLLVGAFVPSVLISFDLQGLVTAMAKAALAVASAAVQASPGDARSVGPAELPGEASSPALSASPSFQASPDAGSRPGPGIDAGGLCAAALAKPVAGGHEWPPGPASSPRSPPSPPALA